ncbi:salivary gland secretion 1 [Gracilaria domingensis]|nr:salivary gland secretion 1 [Gracilaria domingensis]
MRAIKRYRLHYAAHRTTAAGIEAEPVVITIPRVVGRKDVAKLGGKRCATLSLEGGVRNDPRVVGPDVVVELGGVGRRHQLGAEPDGGDVLHGKAVEVAAVQLVDEQALVDAQREQRVPVRDARVDEPAAADLGKAHKVVRAHLRAVLEAEAVGARGLLRVGPVWRLRQPRQPLGDVVQPAAVAVDEAEERARREGRRVGARLARRVLQRVVVGVGDAGEVDAAQAAVVKEVARLRHPAGGGVAVVAGDERRVAGAWAARRAPGGAAGRACAWRGRAAGGTGR